MKNSATFEQNINERAKQAQAFARWCKSLQVRSAAAIAVQNAPIPKEKRLNRFDECRQRVREKELEIAKQKAALAAAQAKLRSEAQQARLRLEAQKAKCQQEPVPTQTTQSWLESSAEQWQAIKTKRILAHLRRRIEIEEKRAQLPATAQVQGLPLPRTVSFSSKSLSSLRVAPEPTNTVAVNDENLSPVAQGQRYSK